MCSSICRPAFRSRNFNPWKWTAKDSCQPRNHLHSYKNKFVNMITWMTSFSGWSTAPGGWAVLSSVGKILETTSSRILTPLGASSLYDLMQYNHHQMASRQLNLYSSLFNFTSQWRKNITWNSVRRPTSWELNHASNRQRSLKCADGPPQISQ